MTLLAFGCRVSPSTEQLAKIDKNNINRIDLLRPARRSTDVDAHLNFHRVVTLALAFRLCVRFALRFAKQLPLWASLSEREDREVDIFEKASQGRFGGLPAVLTLATRSEIKSYRLHCSALHKKLKRLNFRGTAMQWLIDVTSMKHVPLLALIEPHGVPTYVCSSHVLEDSSKSVRLADDYGRKWIENNLRLAKFATADIDRQMRHEVEDQKVYSTVSDSSEHTWIARVGFAQDRSLAQIFPVPLIGLRSS